MKYKLKVSISGILYLMAPILISIIATFLINKPYWNIYSAFFIFIIYFLIIFIYIVSFHLIVEKKTISIVFFGITFYSIKFTEISYVLLTEDGIGITALSKKKVKLIRYNTNGKGHLFSLNNLDGFINILQEQNIKIEYSNNIEKHTNNNNKKTLKILLFILIMTLFADVASIFLWKYLYNIFQSFLTLIIIVANIIIATFIFFILKTRRRN